MARKVCLTTTRSTGGSDQRWSARVQVVPRVDQSDATVNLTNSRSQNVARKMASKYIINFYTSMKTCKMKRNLFLRSRLVCPSYQEFQVAPTRKTWRGIKEVGMRQARHTCCKRFFCTSYSVEMKLRISNKFVKLVRLVEQRGQSIP